MVWIYLWLIALVLLVSVSLWAFNQGEVVRVLSKSRRMIKALRDRSHRRKHRRQF